MEPAPAILHQPSEADVECDRIAAVDDIRAGNSATLEPTEGFVPSDLACARCRG